MEEDEGGKLSAAHNETKVDDSGHVTSQLSSGVEKF